MTIITIVVNGISIYCPRINSQGTTKYSELKGKAETGSTFTNKITQRENEIHQEQLSRKFGRRPPMNDYEIEAEIANPYDSIQKEFQVNLRDLRSLNTERTVP